MYEITPELRHLILYRYPDADQFIDTAKHFIDLSQNEQCLCIHSFFSTGKTRVLLLIKMILEYYNVPVLGITLLNSHANSIEFKTVFSQFNINWITLKPSRMNKSLFNESCYVLIDDALVGGSLVYENIDKFLQARLGNRKPWGGKRIIATTTTILQQPDPKWLAAGISSNNSSLGTFNPVQQDHANKTVSWMKPFKMIELKTNTINAKNILEFTHRIHTYRTNQANPNGRQIKPPAKLGFARLNAGLIITWNISRVHYFNMICQKTRSDSASKYSMPAFYKNKTNNNNKTRTTLKQLIPMTTKLVENHRLNEIIATELCNGDPIIITQSTSRLRKGTTGTYIHPYQIIIEGKNIPITRVKLIHRNVEYRVYPVQLGYATTLVKIIGEKFNKLQIDICHALSGFELCAAITRVQSFKNINFIINDTRALPT